MGDISAPSSFFSRRTMVFLAFSDELYECGGAVRRGGLHGPTRNARRSGREAREEDRCFLFLLGAGVPIWEVIRAIRSAIMLGVVADPCFFGEFF